MAVEKEGSGGDLRPPPRVPQREAYLSKVKTRHAYLSKHVGSSLTLDLFYIIDIDTSRIARVLRADSNGNLEGCHASAALARGAYAWPRERAPSLT